MSDPNEFTSPPQSEGRDALVELALNLHWSWNHGADQLWERLDAELWAATQNPWVILQTVSKDKIKALLAEPERRTCDRAHGCMQNLRKFEGSYNLFCSDSGNSSR